MKNKENNKLSSLELKELFKSYKEGNLSLENTLIEKNINLVHFTINKYFTTYINGIYYEDMISEGLISLLKAVRRYDITSGYTFSTFAIIVIRRDLINFLNKELSNTSHISLDDTLKTSKQNDDRGELKNFINISFDMEKDILGNEYVYAIIKKLPEEYQEIAYLYLIKDINNSFALANYFHISKISMDKKLTELKILLRKCYDEIDLSKEELIYYRFIKLLDKDKNYLYDYVNGLSYSYMSKKYRVNEGTIRRSVEKSMEALNCSFGEIRDMFISKNINMNNLTNTNIDNNKMDYEIINKFADLKERDRKILVARIMQDKLYYKRVLNMYEILPKDASAIYCRIKKNIGYTDNDIEKCFKRNNIFTIYKTLDSKEITTFDLLNNIYNKLPSQISESKYTEILNKYDLLEDLYKKIVYARLSGYSEKEIKEFIKTDVPSLMDKAKSKTESLGNPYEVRLCLSRKLK